MEEMKQQTLAMAADQGFEQYRKTTRRDEFLATMKRIIPCAELCAVVEPYYPKRGKGMLPIGLEQMPMGWFLKNRDLFSEALDLPTHTFEFLNKRSDFLKYA